MNEKPIKKAFKSFLKNKYPESYVAEEKCFKTNPRRVDSRIDVLLIKKRLIVGYEIKSDSDIIKRLDKQIPKYNNFFDKLYLVTTTKHINNALRHIPQYWGLIIAKDTTKIDFEVVRKANININKNLKKLANLLWVADINLILKDFVGRGLNKSKLILKLFELAKEEDILDYVIEKIITSNITPKPLVSTEDIKKQLYLL